MIKTIAAITTMTKTNTKGSHNGLATHHQDHVMCFVSFNTRNTRNKAPEKPIPPPPYVFELLIFLLLTKRGHILFGMCPLLFFVL